MAWTDPKTWTVGEVLTAAGLNTHLRDNLLAVTPAGTVVGYAAASAPSGWLACDGAVVSRSTYAALFAAIADTFGVGDGSTTFGLPDYRGRYIVGLGTHSDVNALTDNDGLAVGSRTPNHAHMTNPDRQGVGSGGTEVTGETLTDTAQGAFGVALYIIKF